MITYKRWFIESGGKSSDFTQHFLQHFLAPVISTFGHMPLDNPARLSRPLRNLRKNDRKDLQPDKTDRPVLLVFSRT